MSHFSAPGLLSSAGARRPHSASDAVEEVALVAASRRALLLRVHRFRLRHEDLEDCYGQATLELIKHARAGGRFANRRHLASVIEQRFLSRVHDRRRALAGRSSMQAALEGALPLEPAAAGQPLEIADARAELERLVLMRHELRRIPVLAAQLSEDQRLVLASQIAQQTCADFCSRHGWSAEKYRKVAQRARARLRALLEREEAAVPGAEAGSERPAGTDL
jgi:DNA-directed RNA polymerase specialized sigma24 family protein